MNRTLALMLAAALGTPLAASAQDAGVDPCSLPTLERPTESYPADGAGSVSIDAPLRIRYTPAYFAPGGPGTDPTRLLDVRRCGAGCDRAACSDASAPVGGRVQVLGDELVFFPDALRWDTAATYRATALGRDGDLAVSFCTGSSPDDLPPVLGAIDELRSDPAEPRCEAPDGGFRVGVFFRPAIDSGPPGSIEYLLFQTRGAGVDAPILRDRVRNYPGEQITMAFVLPPDEASTPICVRVVAVDGVGNFALSDRRGDGDEACLDPVRGNDFFPLCGASTRGGAGGGAVSLVALIALALLGARRRRRG